MKRFIAVILAALVMGGLVSTSVSASPPKHLPRLILDNGTDSGCGTASEIGWVNGNSSPLDGNNQALSIRTNAGECSFAYQPKWGPANNALAKNVRNLSFDFLTPPGGYVGGGAPRISVDLDLDGNGSYDTSASLAASACSVPLSDGWARADFTGQTTVGCAVYLNSDGTTPAAVSDGTDSAWENFGEIYPLARLTFDPYVVVDEPTVGSPAGRVLIDRIAIHNRMQRARFSVRTCPSESSC